MIGHGARCRMLHFLESRSRTLRARTRARPAWSVEFTSWKVDNRDANSRGVFLGSLVYIRRRRRATATKEMVEKDSWFRNAVSFLGLPLLALSLPVWSSSIGIPLLCSRSRILGQVRKRGPFQIVAAGCFQVGSVSTSCKGWLLSRGEIFQRKIYLGGCKRILEF